MMFEDDDFFINDDELAEENQLTITDTAMMNLLDSIIRAAQDMKDNLKFSEKTDSRNNLQLITSFVGCLNELSKADLDKLSADEAESIIDKILRQTTELTFNNIDEVLPGTEEEITELPISDNDDSTDW